MTEDPVDRRLAQLQHGRRLDALQQPTQLADLRARLNEAAAWCAQYVNLGDIRSCLRPPRIAPRPRSAERWHGIENTRPLLGSRWSDVDDISAARRSDPFEVMLHAVTEGRLLVYFPDADLRDGAAEVASKGFFDVYNAPPWGTWVGYFDDGGSDPSFRCYLLAWVPRALLNAAGDGIRVNPEGCIAWLEDVDVGLRPVISQFIRV